jgi:hypothetical protein
VRRERVRGSGLSCAPALPAPRAVARSSRFLFRTPAGPTVPGPIIPGNGAVGASPAVSVRGRPLLLRSHGAFGGTRHVATLRALLAPFAHGSRLPRGERKASPAKEFGKTGRRRQQGPHSLSVEPGAGGDRGSSPRSPPAPGSTLSRARPRSPPAPGSTVAFFCSVVLSDWGRNGSQAILPFPMAPVPQR